MNVKNGKIENVIFVLNVGQSRLEQLRGDGAFLAVLVF